MKTIILGALCAAAGLAGSAGAQTRLAFEGAAEPLLPGFVTRQYDEVQASFLANGELVVFGCDDCPMARGGGDVFEARFVNGTWIGPGRARPSITAKESGPSFTPDGTWLYYVSNHRGGVGGMDLHRVSWRHGQQRFGMPENLGPSINSPGEEGAASAGVDGDYLVFGSRGRKGARGWALFESRRAGGKMTPARRLEALDTAQDEFEPALLAGDAGLVFTRGTLDGASSLWFAPRRGEGYGEPVRLPDTVNAPGTSTRGPQQDHRDPAYLLFTRVGADGQGDILRIRYRVEAAAEGARAADDR